MNNLPSQSIVVFFETSDLSILFFLLAVGSVQECVAVHIGTWYGFVIPRSVEGLLEFGACMAFLVAQIAKVYLLSLTWKDSP